MAKYLELLENKKTAFAKEVTDLPTTSSSMSDGLFRMRVHMSIVNIVELELNIEVNELIKAASITANISPVKPTTFN